MIPTFYEQTELRPFLVFYNDFCKSKKNIEDFKLKLYEIHVYILKVYKYFFFLSFFLITLTVFLILKKISNKKILLTSQNAKKEMRLNFSREVHDGIAQDLAALKLTLKSGNIEKANYFAEHAFNESRYLIEETNINFSGDFIQYIKEMLSSFESNFAIKTEFLCASEKIQKIPQNYKQSLLKILNESLSNVVRHSNATNVKIKIIDLTDGFRFIVSDNGGENGSRNLYSSASSKEILNQVQNDEHRVQNDTRKHFGLENIQERAKEMNGEAEINLKNEEGGTTVAVTIKDFVR